MTSVPSPIRPPGLDGAAWTMLLALSALWGGSFFFFKVLVAEYPPLTVVLGRVGFATIALNLLLAVRGDPMRRALPWAKFAVMGLLNNIFPFVLIVFGEMRISSGLASILNATTPLFGVLVAHAFTTNEKLTVARGAGVLFGLAGVAILIGPSALAGLTSGDLAGEGACLLAALFYAVAGIYGRRFRGLPPLQIATGQITASAALLLPVTTIIDHPWTLAPPSLHAWGAFAGISLLCTALAYLLYFRILAIAGATNLLLVTFLLPVSALLLGWLALDETIEPRAFAGMALIGLGLAAIDGRILRVLRWAPV